VAGPGKHGADVRACHRHLMGCAAELIDFAAGPEAALARLLDAVKQPPAWILDGLFGIGLNRPLDGLWAGAVDALNRSGAPIIAVDVPSGLNLESGAATGSVIEAVETWSLGAVKAGLLPPTVARFVGRVDLVADIGLVGMPTTTDPRRWISREDFTGFPPRRPVESHKGTFGHAVVVAGSAGFHGAGVLATRAALRARPGLVTLIIAPEVLAVAAAQLAAPLVVGYSDKVKVPDNTTAVVVGPGLAARDLPVAIKDLSVRLWRQQNCPVIADASALEWLPPRPVNATAPRILTPHPGEAATILHITTDEVQADRPGAVREISRLFGGAWVVLKGRHTLVGRHEGDLLVNSSGNSGLAQGGSGDVLAGFMAGLIAQPALASEPLRAVSFAVWRHGDIADQLETVDNHWTAEELAQAIRS
jgi:ADP-dependent NAD(P)H-hydrate dehydratase / NAD(P)H-hydrate epimerase